MQTILGANGIIGEELAKELKNNYTSDLKLVGRNPHKVNDTDTIFKADLLKPDDVMAALADTEIAYMTVGLPYRSDVWSKDWIIIMKNVIAGCKANNCKLVYFDNTYAYAQGSKIQIEDSTFASSGAKGKAKKETVEFLLAAMEKKEIEAVICRAPEFYGPGKTKGITNSLIFESLKNNKTPKVFINDKVLRSLIYTPDASKATALIANNPDTYGQTWHLPCDDNRLTYQQFIAEISNQLGRPIKHKVLSTFILKILSLFNSNVKETKELFPRYAIDNIFDSSKFKERFPDFKVTTYQEGIRNILDSYEIK